MGRPDQIPSCYTSNMIRLFGKLVGGSMALVLGIGMLSIACKGNGCGAVFSSILSEVTETTELNIQITSPINNQVVRSPLLILGSARVFEGKVFYEISDSLGHLLGEGLLNTNGSNARKLLPFNGTVVFSTPNSPAGKLNVFDRSVKDDSIIDLVTIPLIFTPDSSS